MSCGTVGLVVLEEVSEWWAWASGGVGQVTQINFRYPSVDTVCSPWLFQSDDPIGRPVGFPHFHIFVPRKDTHLGTKKISYKKITQARKEEIVQTLTLSRETFAVKHAQLCCKCCSGAPSSGVQNDPRSGMPV